MDPGSGGGAQADSIAVQHLPAFLTDLDRMAQQLLDVSLRRGDLLGAQSILLCSFWASRFVSGLGRGYEPQSSMTSHRFDRPAGLEVSPNLRSFLPGARRSVGDGRQTKPGPLCRFERRTGAVPPGTVGHRSSRGGGRHWGMLRPKPRNNRSVSLLGRRGVA